MIGGAHKDTVAAGLVILVVGLIVAVISYLVYNQTFGDWVWVGVGIFALGLVVAVIGSLLKDKSKRVSWA